MSAHSMRDIKNRIDGVSQTRQITGAMYLLSSSRLKKLTGNMEYTLRYMNRLRKTMADVLHVTKGAGIQNRFLDKDSKGTALFMPVMGDKGLCGSYNMDVVRLTQEKLAKYDDAMVYCFGELGKDLLTAKGVRVDRVLPGSSMHPDVTLSRELAAALIDMYVTDKVNEVYIIYTPFVKGAREPVSFRLLPLLRHDFQDLGRDKAPEEMLYEPSAEEVFEHMVPLYCSSMIYDFLVQSSASENAARMEAMKAASDAADEMIGSLTAELNAVRQLSITQEITEIAAATLQREVREKPAQTSAENT